MLFVKLIKKHFLKRIKKMFLRLIKIYLMGKSIAVVIALPASFSTNTVYEPLNYIEIIIF